MNEREKQSLLTGKGMPPIRIRVHNSEEQKRLNDIVDGFVLVPVFNYLHPNEYDDLNQEGCDYAW